MDTFTSTHLENYLSSSVFEDERAAFRAWVTEETDEDPSLLDRGWESLYRTWKRCDS